MSLADPQQIDRGAAFDIPGAILPKPMGGGLRFKVLRAGSFHPVTIAHTVCSVPGLRQGVIETGPLTVKLRAEFL